MNQRILSFDGHFDEIKHFLTPCARILFEVPNYAEVALNLVSMGNYLPILNPLLVAISPSLVCEIGAYRGVTTRALAELSVELGASLHVVDPAISANDAPVKVKGVKYFQMLSEEYLPMQHRVDVFFIDGDHNHEVVTKELELIVSNQNTDIDPILVMHDVGWPCAYRDMYYDLSRINNRPEVIEKSRINLTLPENMDFDIFLSVKYDFAGHEGGPGNGVRRAIEDFLDRHKEWRMISIPSLYGLGVLWNTNRVTDSVAAELEKLSTLFDRARPFLGILELNRVLLLSEIADQGEEWKANQAYIATANSRVGELNGRVEELNGQIALLNLEVAKSLERVAYLESWKGALKQLLRILGRRS